MHLATAGEAKAQFMTILMSEAVSTDAILSLIEDIEAGQVVGRDCERCPIALLAYYSEKTYESFRRRFGFSPNWRENPFEVFVQGIFSGHTPAKNSDLAHVLVWCDEALIMRAERSVLETSEVLAS